MAKLEISFIFSLDFHKSSTHTLTDLPESIRQTLNEDNFGCEIFLDFQKSFCTIDHKVLVHKLEYYGIFCVWNDWFKSYLSDLKQFVSINDYNSDLMPINYVVPEGSIPGPLLLLVYINPIQDGPFRGCSRIQSKKMEPFLKSVTHVLLMMKVNTIVLYLKKI